MIVFFCVGCTKIVRKKLCTKKISAYVKMIRIENDRNEFTFSMNEEEEKIYKMWLLDKRDGLNNLKKFSDWYFEKQPMPLDVDRKTRSILDERMIYCWIKICNLCT